MSFISAVIAKRFGDGLENRFLLRSAGAIPADSVRKKSIKLFRAVTDGGSMEQVKLTLDLLKPGTRSECKAVKTCRSCYYFHISRDCPEFEDDSI